MPDVNSFQAQVDKLLAAQGLPPGSIIVVEDDRPPLPTALQIIEALRPEDFEVFKPMNFSPDSLEVHTWELYHHETEEGIPVVPDSLVIGFTELKFDDDLDEFQTNQAIQVGKMLEQMIEEAKDRRRVAEIIADTGEAIPGTADMGAKLAVRDREQLIRCIEKGYRVYFDHKQGVQFLRCPGRPDINYEL